MEENKHILGKPMKGSTIFYCINLALAYLIKNIGFGQTPKSVGRVISCVTRPIQNSSYITLIHICTHLFTKTYTLSVYYLSRSSPVDLRRFEIRFEFESDDSDSIRFESDGLIRNFRIGRTCRHTTNYSHCSTKTSTIAPL